MYLPCSLRHSISSRFCKKFTRNSLIVAVTGLNEVTATLFSRDLSQATRRTSVTWSTGEGELPDRQSHHTRPATQPHTSQLQDTKQIRLVAWSPGVVRKPQGPAVSEAEGAGTVPLPPELLWFMGIQ